MGIGEDKRERSGEEVLEEAGEQGQNVHASRPQQQFPVRARKGSGRQIKNISPELRRPRLKPPAGRSWRSRILWRLRNDSQFLRTMVQVAFALLCVWIGVEFHLFMRWGVSNGELSFVERPPGVEGFLPISALISLHYWIETGIVNTIHPSALFILVSFVLISIGLKKGFCSWLCPIGTLSESLWMLGERLFRRNLRVTRWLDYPLRSLKYLLLFFFVNAIWQMDVTALRDFIASPYNKMADVKMYLFFATLSSTALWTILAIVVVSVLVKNFWCRFLCPYGALLGFLSFLSPLKVTRQKSTCVDCELCTKACPASINVHKVKRVWSDECTACYKCVEVCPVKNTLEVRLPKGTRPVPGWVFGGLLVGVFIAVTGMAMVGGLWHNSITREEYQRRFQELNTPAYEHFGARE